MISDIRSFKGIVPKIADSAYIDPACTIIGDVEIGEESSVWCGTVIRGDVHHIRIGDRTNVQDLSLLHVTHAEPENNDPGHPLIIGSDVTIGHRVTLHGCTLQDGCFIGMGVTILDGAVVETGAFIGANSLVTGGKIIEGGWLYMGAPAKKVRQLTPEEMEDIKQSAVNYVNYSREYISSVESVD